MYNIYWNTHKHVIFQINTQDHISRNTPTKLKGVVRPLRWFVKNLRNKWFKKLEARKWVEIKTQNNQTLGLEEQQHVQPIVFYNKRNKRQKSSQNAQRETKLQLKLKTGSCCPPTAWWDTSDAWPEPNTHQPGSEWWPIGGSLCNPPSHILPWSSGLVLAIVFVYVPIPMKVQKKYICTNKSG